MPTSTLVGPDTTDVLVSEAFVFATIGTELADGQPFGKLQDGSLTIPQEWITATVPGKFTHGAAYRTMFDPQFSFRHGAFRENALRALLGGVLAEAAGKTTYTLKNTDTPKSFDMHGKSPSAAEDWEFKLYGCRCTNVELPLAPKNFVFPNFQGNAMGKSTGEVFEWIQPGNQMVS